MTASIFCLQNIAKKSGRHAYRSKQISHIKTSIGYGFNKLPQTNITKDVLYILIIVLWCYIFCKSRLAGFTWTRKASGWLNCTKILIIYLASKSFILIAETHTSEFCYRQVTVQKWSVPLRISSVNVTNSVGSCGFGHIYWRNLSWKTSLFVQCVLNKCAIQR